jgi:hypothetical protein
VFLGVVGCFWFCKLSYCICTPECVAYVSVFEEIDKFSHSWTIVSKDCPFFVSVLSGFWWIYLL